MLGIMQLRQNFRYGGDTMGGPNDRSRGDGARDRGMGMAGKTGDYSSGPTSVGGRDNRFTDLTKDVLNPQKDIFTQSYQAPGIFGLGGGYRDLNVPGDTSQGFKQGIGSKILGGILGLINPVLGLGYRAITSAPGVYDKFKSSSTLEQFRDQLRGYGRTMPVYSNNPAFGGIESLGKFNNEESLQAYVDYLANTPDDPITFEQFLMQTGLK